ncbi:MAG: luxQ [Nevskia sp.]|nr:luxQ [Nevskia sp.]
MAGANADAAGDPDQSQPGVAFPIVGVGASAGGLEAFTQLLKALPVDTGMAFVLVQHLAPTHASALAEILSRATKMPVTEVAAANVVEPNHVYVIPPGQCMAIAGGTLQLVGRESVGQQRVIDHFFRTLAIDARHQAIGVVLSGTATDGTLGLESIKAEGGITFAQDASAQQQGMPHSAIVSGCVDFVLPPDQIAAEIVRISRHPYAAPERKAAIVTRAADAVPNLGGIVQLLHSATGVDFSGYKFNTFYRRVTRRMVLQKMDALADYLELLRQTPAEVEALYQDVLIGVTSFFRDPQAYEALKSKVFPGLIAGRSRQDPVRIWALGCSTGQEAYSLAMAFVEFAAAQNSNVPLQLFATDLNGASIDRARAGVYPKDIAQDVSPERLRHFFGEIDGGYRIAKSIRDVCVFSRHDALTDPPFSRMDLISCRNLLIYLEPELQRRVVSTLHYALKTDGYLWLGGSETIGAYRKLFAVQDAKHKLYAKKAGATPGRSVQKSGDMPRVPFNPPFMPGKNARSGDGPSDLLKEADRVLLNRFAPPGVLVSSDLEILQYRGDTDAYLTPAAGKASLNLLKMLREGLLVGVRAATLRAREDQTRVRQEGLRVKSSTGGYRDVAIEVLPLTSGGAQGVQGAGFLILFEDAGAANAEPRPPAAAAGAEASLASEADLARLTQELAATREYLQAVIEQQERANEELQSANEEVQSANEELQSTNEELETSKEEIQSSNEELVTVNDELNNRNTELNRLNNDLVNVLDSVQMAIVIVGADLRIRRFTPAAEKLFSLIASDVGRPLCDIQLKLEPLPELETLLNEVLATGSPRECEVRNPRGHWYSLRLRPYRTLDHKLDGVVVVLVDVDAIKRAHEYTESIVATVSQPLLVLDAGLRVRTSNDAFYQTFRVTPEATENRLVYEIGNGQWDIPELRRLLEQLLPRDNQIRNFEVQHEFEQIGVKVMRINACRLLQLGEHNPAILLSIDDVTEPKRLETELESRVDELGAADLHKNEFLAMLAHELRNPLAPIRNALQIMRLKHDSGEVVEVASAMMERQIAQMVRLVDDLLDVSRISRGKIELRRVRMELASTLYQAIEAAQPTIQAMGHEFDLSLPPQPLYLNADPVRLAQVIGNLLHNACKFTDKGGHIGLNVEVEGSDVVIRVRDNGIGIATESLARIFNMFVQVDASLGRTVGGLGMGLTLVRNLVEMHDGSVVAHSDGLGQGSEFVVRLPIPPQGAKLPTALPPQDETVGGEATPVSGRRILVVDDNHDSADSLALLLEFGGNQTQTAYDGLAAVATAATFRPEVVILDLGLPNMNGYQVARQIRRQAWGRHMVLVALTGWGQPEARKKSTDAGFDGHLVKPVDEAALARLLAEIDQRRSRR